MKMKIYPRGTQAKARGAATVEFALVLGFFYIPALLIIFDFGRVFFAAMSVTSAAHGMALYEANSYWASTDGTWPTIPDPVDLAENLEPNLKTTVSGLSATHSPMYKCSTDKDQGYQTSIPTCNSPATLYEAVNVTVSGEFKTLIDYSFIPHITDLKSSAWIRVK